MTQKSVFTSWKKQLSKISQKKKNCVNWEHKCITLLFWHFGFFSQKQWHLDLKLNERGHLPSYRQNGGSLHGGFFPSSLDVLHHFLITSSTCIFIFQRSHCFLHLTHTGLCTCDWFLTNIFPKWHFLYYGPLFLLKFEKCLLFCCSFDGYFIMTDIFDRIDEQ